MRLTTTLGFVVLSGLCVSPALAQSVSSSFEQASATLRAGELVLVEDDAGERAKGKVIEVSASEIAIRTGGPFEQRRTFAADRVARLSRIDSRRNGFLIGVAAGAGPGLLAGRTFNEYCNNESAGHCPIAFLIFGGVLSGIGGWIGWGIDNLIIGETLVYSKSGVPLPIASTPIAPAASSFTELRLLVRPGQTVVVTDAAGAQVTGKLAVLSAASMSVASRGFAETEVRRIERLGDTLWNGAVIGFGAGVGVGIVTVAASDCRELVCALVVGPSLLLGGALGTVAGVVADALHKKRTVVFVARDQAERAREEQKRSHLFISPLLSESRQGVLVTVRF